MTSPTETEDKVGLRWFGRRKGRGLTRARQALVDTVLPRLRIASGGADEPVDVLGLFPQPMSDLWLEVGFGAGEHLAAQAQAHPDTGFIGCEPYINGIAGLLFLIDQNGSDNIRVFDNDVRSLLPRLPEASLGRVFVLYPDPWPKKRHHQRRLIQPGTLDQLARLMKDGAELCFASDHMEYARWVLFHVTNHSSFAWTATRPSHWRQRPSCGIQTRYEAKAKAQGSACVYLNFRRLPRSSCTSEIA